MKYTYLLLGCIFFFLLYKITNNNIRLSDTNIYFYTAYQLLEGKVLYKDIFFTNFPLLPYISTVYYYLVGKRLDLFYLTASFEVIATTSIIYIIVKNKYQDKLLAVTTCILYLFSFLVLTTSDHQSGVFLASFFTILTYYFYDKKMYFLSGIFTSLMLLTKAYFLPVVLTIGLILLFQRKNISLSKVLKNQLQTLGRYICGIIITTIIILLPSLLFARNDFITNVFIYSLTRSQGIPKSEIFWFFITHDFLLFLLLFWNIVTIKIYRFFGVFSLLSLIFFFGYKDIYYLYLNFVVVFLCLSYPNFALFVQKNTHVNRFFLPTLVLFFSCINLFIYTNSYKDLQKIENVGQIIQTVQEINPPVIYGTNDLAPALAYLTNIPLLNGIIDTNTNIFRKGLLNKNTMTHTAIEQKALIVGHGAYYPNVGVKNDLIDEIFDISAIEKSCILSGSFPVRAEGVGNRITVHKCQ